MLLIITWVIFRQSSSLRTRKKILFGRLNCTVVFDDKNFESPCQPWINRLSSLRFLRRLEWIIWPSDFVPFFLSLLTFQLGIARFYRDEYFVENKAIVLIKYVNVKSIYELLVFEKDSFFISRWLPSTLRKLKLVRILPWDPAFFTSKSSTYKSHYVN